MCEKGNNDKEGVHNQEREKLLYRSINHNKRKNGTKNGIPISFARGWGSRLKRSCNMDMGEGGNYRGGGGVERGCVTLVMQIQQLG